MIVLPGQKILAVDQHNTFIILATDQRPAIALSKNSNFILKVTFSPTLILARKFSRKQEAGTRRVNGSLSIANNSIQQCVETNIANK